MSAFQYRGCKIDITIVPVDNGGRWVSDLAVDGLHVEGGVPLTCAVESAIRYVNDMEDMQALGYAVPTFDFVKCDGGRSSSKRYNQKNDCAVRALAITTGRSYDRVYDELAALGRKSGAKFKLETAELGEWIPFPAEKGWSRMYPGAFCALFNQGRYIMKTAKHFIAVIDGVIYDEMRPDTYRCVYGAWRIS